MCCRQCIYFFLSNVTINVHNLSYNIEVSRFSPLDISPHTSQLTFIFLFPVSNLFLRVTADREVDYAVRVQVRRYLNPNRSRRANLVWAWRGPTQADAQTPIFPRPPRITSLPILLRKPGPLQARPPRPVPGRGHRRRPAPRHRRPLRPPRPPRKAAPSKAQAQFTAWRGAR